MSLIGVIRRPVESRLKTGPFSSVGQKDQGPGVYSLVCIRIMLYSCDLHRNVCVCVCVCVYYCPQQGRSKESFKWGSF